MIVAGIKLSSAVRLGGLATIDLEGFSRLGSVSVGRRPNCLNSDQLNGAAVRRACRARYEGYHLRMS